MPIAHGIKETMLSPGAAVIRRMFEEGIRLKERYGEDKVFDFSLGNPDLEPPPEVFEAIRAVAAEQVPHKHGYMPNAGYGFAREAMARKTTAEQGVRTDASCIVMSSGAAAALNCVFKAILNPGDTVVVPAPFFAEYRHYVANQSAVLVEVPSGEDFSLDVGAVRAALTEKTAAVLINSPNNPSGKVYAQQEIDALAAVLAEHGARCGRMPYLVCDEPYRDIVYDGREVASVFPAYPSAVVVTSFAKNLSLPGERIGYIAANPAMPDKDEFIAACVFATRTLGFVNAPAFFQRVAAMSWSARQDFSSYERRRDMIMRVLDEAGIRYFRPEGAFYLFCSVPDSFAGDDAAFCALLKSHNILCAPGGGFGRGGWFRLSYCVPEQTILDSKAAFCMAVAEQNGGKR